ncbi:extracellular solute-binding protein [Burkholderia cepacia]|uniref:extracellular solute-binding protein n=1 Tax=Burkholderia cepacia TaxID=292 RepID=UPI002AB775CC|nr:extracellular solute-binding protein [Burkholderia cepacia]
MKNIDRRNFLLTTAVSAAALAAASPRITRAQSSPVVLKVQYAYAKTYEPIMTDIAKRFGIQNPSIRIEFQAPATDYGDLEQRTLRAAITGGLPDVAFHGLNNLDLLAQRGLIAPLNPLIATEKNWSKLGYSPSLLSLASANGSPFSLPFAIAIKSIYFNLDLVKRAGGDPENLPKTWDGIISLQKKIQALGGDITGMYVDYYFDDNNFCFQSLVETQGGVMATPDNRVAFDGKEGLQALRWLNDIGNAGMVDMTIDQAYQSFSAGTMGILVASSSRVTQLVGGVGNRFPVRVTGFPHTPNGRVPGGGAGAMIHSKDPVKQKAAWEFIKFATGPVGSTVLVNNSGYIPGNTLAASDPNLLGNFYARNPAYRAMFDQIPALTKFYSWPGENSMKIPMVIRDYLQKVVTRRATPEQVLPLMAADVRKLLPA